MLEIFTVMDPPVFRIWGVRGPRTEVQGLPALHGQQLGRQNAEGGRMKLINIIKVKVKCILNSSLLSYERMFVFPNRFRSSENIWASNLNPAYCTHAKRDHVNLVRKHCNWHQRLVRLRPKRQKKLSGFFLSLMCTTGHLWTDGLSKLLRGTLDNHPNYFLPVEPHKKLKVKKSILIGRESDGRIYFHKAKMGRERRSLKLTWKITRQPSFLSFLSFFQCIRLMGRPECRVPFGRTDRETDGPLLDGERERRGYGLKLSTEVRGYTENIQEQHVCGGQRS